MTVAVDELERFVNKNVILHVKQEDNSLREVEGKVEAASAAGMAFKEKGKSKLDLVMPEQIEEITLAPTKPKSVLQKKLKPIEEAQARQHLVDRHGVPLSWAKENTDQDAFAYHESLDHSNLGHKHVAEEVKPSERDEALADDEA
jgi:hypothetical protein